MKKNVRESEVETYRENKSIHKINYIHVIKNSKTKMYAFALDNTI